MPADNGWRLSRAAYSGIWRISHPGQQATTPSFYEVSDFCSFALVALRPRRDLQQRLTE